MPRRRVAGECQQWNWASEAGRGRIPRGGGDPRHHARGPPARGVFQDLAHLWHANHLSDLGSCHECHLKCIYIAFIVPTHPPLQGGG